MGRVPCLLQSGLVFLVLAFLAGGACFADPVDVRDVIKKSYKVRPGGTLYVDMDRGPVEIVSRRTSEVLIEIEIVADAEDGAEAKRLMENYRPDFEQRGNNIFVRSRFENREPGPWGRYREWSKLKVKVTVQVPHTYNVDFATGMGHARVGDLDGTVTGRTGQGGIQIGSVSGAIDVSTGTGNIDLAGSKSSVKASTGAGNINLHNVEGAVHLNTGAGDIYAELTEQPARDSHLSTGAGNVTIALDSDLSLNVRAVANVGSAQSDFPFRVSGKWMKKEIDGRMGGGGPFVSLRTGIGNVSIKKL